MAVAFKLVLPSGDVAIYDPKDDALVQSKKWHIHGGGPNRYVAHQDKRDGRRIVTYLHRFLMNPPAGMVVDHVNGNPLDNRRCNLRVCSPQENARNRQRCVGTPGSTFRGVTWSPSAKRWAVTVKTKFVGHFDGEIEAAIAYDIAALRAYGAFATLNFLGAPYGWLDPAMILPPRVAAIEAETRRAPKDYRLKPLPDFD